MELLTGHLTIIGMYIAIMLGILSVASPSAFRRRVSSYPLFTGDGINTIAEHYFHDENRERFRSFFYLHLAGRVALWVFVGAFLVNVVAVLVQVIPNATVASSLVQASEEITVGAPHNETVRLDSGEVALFSSSVGPAVYSPEKTAPIVWVLETSGALSPEFRFGPIALACGVVGLLFGLFYIVAARTSKPGGV